VKAVEGGVVDYPVNLPEVSVMERPILKAYCVLAQKLGSMVGQIIDFNPQVVEAYYRGELAELDPTLIRLGFMQGYAGQVLNEYVSFVNAGKCFDKLGIKFEEKEDPGFESYKSAIKLTVRGADEKRLSVGGIVFDERYVRLTLIDDFYFEMEPTGSHILMENHDRPGVIGNIGQFLASHKINIDSFALSRNRQGGRAMALIRVDSKLVPEQLEQMRKVENILAVKTVDL